MKLNLTARMARSNCLMKWINFVCLMLLFPMKWVENKYLDYFLLRILT